MRPDPPTEMDPRSADGALMIHFEPPPWNGGGNITAYRVRLDGVLLGTSSSSPIVAGTLVNGVAYNLTLEAQNWAGTSELARVPEAVPARVPSAPQNVSFFAADEAITVSFRMPADDGGAAIDHRLSAGLGGSTSVESSDLKERDLKLLELTNGAAYFCSLRARNRMGLGEAAVSDRLVPFQMGLRGWQTSLVVIGAVIAATLFCMAGWALWLRHICDFSTARDRENEGNSAGSSMKWSSRCILTQQYY